MRKLERNKNPKKTSNKSILMISYDNRRITCGMNVHFKTNIY